MKSSSVKVKMYGLVRDVNGKPKIDDKNNIPVEIWNMLTNAEQEEILSWRRTQQQLETR